MIVPSEFRQYAETPSCAMATRVCVAGPVAITAGAGPPPTSFAESYQANTAFVERELVQTT
jgi:hypothetical protein